MIRAEEIAHRMPEITLSVTSGTAGIVEILRDSSERDRQVLSDPNPDLATLALLDGNLSLLELLVDNSGTNAVARMVQRVCSASLGEAPGELRALRTIIDQAARHLLALFASRHTDVDVRRAAASAIIYQASPDETIFLQGLFESDATPQVREVTIYALKPQENEGHKTLLRETFDSFTPRLRLSAIELLKPCRNKDAKISEFFARRDVFSPDEWTVITDASR